MNYCLSSDFWQNRNETKNFNQRHEVELIKEEKRKVIEAQIRLQVMLTTKQQQNMKHIKALHIQTTHVRNLTGNWASLL